MNENDICPVCSEGHIVKEDDKKYCNKCGTAFRHPTLYWDGVDAKIVSTGLWGEGNEMKTYCVYKSIEWEQDPYSYSVVPVVHYNSSCDMQLVGCLNDVDVYYTIFEKETSINLYHMEYEYQPTQETVEKALLAMNVSVVIEEE